ncbi:unnamed protein product [Leuciscus chuanchicus]
MEVILMKLWRMTGPDANDIPDDLDVPADRVVREQWILAMFREEEEDMRVFVGFQEEWKTDNFHSREKIPYKREPGVKIELPDVVTPIQGSSSLPDPYHLSENWSKSPYNLQINGFICTEDIEIIQRSTTKTDQVITGRSALMYPAWYSLSSASRSEVCRRL